VNAARGMEIEIEIAMRAAETATLTIGPSPGRLKFWLATGPEIWSMIRSTPSPPVPSALIDPAGIFRIDREIAPKSFNRPRRAASVEEPITIVAP